MPLQFTGYTVEGHCDVCPFEGMVAICTEGDHAESLVYLCRGCGQERQVNPTPIVEGE